MANDFLSYLQQNAVKPNSVRNAYVPGKMAGRATGRGTGVPTYSPSAAPSSGQAGPDYSGGFMKDILATLDRVTPDVLENPGMRALDVLSRPSYAVNNIVENMGRNRQQSINEGDNTLEQILQNLRGISEVPGQAWQGLSGQDKVVGSEVIDSVGGKNMNPWAKGALGLGIDIFADPTTYLGVGAIKSLAKIPVNAARGIVDAADMAALETKATTALGEIASKEIKNVPEYSGPGRALSPQEINPALKPRTNLQKAAEVSKAKYAPTKATEVAKVAKVPTIKLAELPIVARKALTTADVASAGFKFTPPAPEIVKQAAGYKLPPPVGKSLKGTPEEPLVTPGSTTNFARPSAEASNRAEAIISNAQDFLSTAKNTAKASKDYLNGFVRPTLDTPAETEFLKQMGIGPEVQFFKLPRQERFRLTQPYSADAQITKPPNTVKVKIAGEKVPTEISSNTLWDFLHGKSVTIGDRLVTPGEVLLKGKGAKSGYRMTADSVVKKNQAALDNPKFWDQAKANATKLSHPDNAAGVAHNVARQQREYVRQANNIVYNDLKEWKELVGKTYPAISSEGLDAAYTVVQDAMKAQWTKVKSGTLSQEEFMITTNTSSRLQDMMNRAINENANPEKIIADTAEVMAESQTETLRLTTEAMSLITDLKAKTAVAEDLSRQINEAQATVEAAQAVEKAAPAKRMVDAQTAKGDVTDEVRQAATTNGLSPSAQAVIDAGDFASSSTLGVDKAIGLVKSNSAETLTAIKKHGFGYNTPKQTNNINRLVNATSPLARKSPKTVARIANIIRATERNLEELGGHMPTAWNFKKGAERRNVGFSSAKLLEDMLAIDSTVGLKALFGGGDTQWWNKVVTAAAFKDKKALDAITDPDLKKFLKAYDPRHNIEVVDNVGVGKVNANVEAQANAAANNAAVSATTSSPARAAMDAANAPKVADKAIQRTPGTPADARPLIDGAAGNAADKMLDTLIGPKTPVEIGVETNKNGLMQAVKGTNVATGNRISRSIVRLAGSKAANPGKTISDAAFDIPWMRRVGGVFSTHVGAKVTRPMMQNSMDQITQLMSSTSRDWDDIQKRLRALPDGEGVKVIKSLNPENGVSGLSPEGTALFDEIRQSIESSLGGKGSNIERHIAGNSSAAIAAMTRDNMNSWLSAKRVKGADGKIFKLGEEDTAAGWLGGWAEEVAKFDDPHKAIHFLHGLEQGVYHAAVERNFYDDLAVRFGRQGLHTTDNPYLKGVGFSEEIAPQINQVMTLMEALKNPKSAGKIMQFYDQALRLWKTGKTIYTPSHHIRNAIGDTWFMQADGGGIRHLNKATKLMIKFRDGGKYLNMPEGATSSRGLTMADAKDIDGLMKKILGEANGKISVVNKASKKSISEDQVMAAANKYGLFQNAGTVEDIMDASSITSKVPSRIKAPFNSKVHDAVVTAAEGREHSIRLAHFLHALEDTRVVKPKGMSDAVFAAKKEEMLFEQAAQRVRKWHPDGMDLTNAERKVGRRIIPFYSWQRKSIPLILTTAIQRPGLVTAYPKTLAAVSGAAGTETGNPFNDYLPGDQMFDIFSLQEPSASFGTSINAGGEGYTTATGPSSPGLDFMNMLNAPKREALGLLSPVAGVVSEAVNGTYFGTDIPMDKGSQVQNIIQQATPTPVAGWVGSKNTLQNNVLNALLGLGLRDTGDPKYQKSAQYATLDKLKAGVGQ